MSSIWIWVGSRMNIILIFRTLGLTKASGIWLFLGKIVRFWGIWKSILM